MAIAHTARFERGHFGHAADLYMDLSALPCLTRGIKAGVLLELSQTNISAGHHFQALVCAQEALQLDWNPEGHAAEGKPNEDRLDLTWDCRKLLAPPWM